MEWDGSIPGLDGSGLGAFLTPQALSAALQARSFSSAKGFVACILCCAKATFCCQGDGVTEIEGLCVCKTLQCLKWDWEQPSSICSFVAVVVVRFARGNSEP